MSTKRKPDYDLSALNKADDRLKGKVGAAWINEDGTISVVLNPFTYLHQDGHLLLTLFPKNLPPTGQ